MMDYELLEFAEKMDLIGTPLTDLGKYISLVYGISQVVGDQPKIDKVVYAGIAYLACSFLNNVCRKGVTTRQIGDLEKKLNKE